MRSSSNVRAYEILGDESLRKNFDSFSTGNERKSRRTSSSTTQSRRKEEPVHDHASFRDTIFNEFDEFYQFKVKKASSRGEDIHTELNLTFHEAVEGCGKTIHYNRMIGCEDCSGSGAFSPDSFRRCFTCGGRGFVFHKSAKHGSEVLCDKCDGKGKIIYESCEPCGGSGQVTIREHEYITVPIGVRGDQKLRLEGKGWN